LDIDIRQVDDDGNEHFVWVQEREDTCAPACILMMERIVFRRCVQGGEDRVREIARLFPKGYSEGTGVAAYSAIESALKLVGIPVIARRVTSFADLAKAANFPFIARIGWTNGGGHFVVCAAITASGRLVCLDPYHGLAQPPVNMLPSYSVAQNARVRQSLATPIHGAFSGHIVEMNASV
jgi:Peptidase C39 family